MKRIVLFLFLVQIFPFDLRAQELYPNTEPASNVPKGVFGIKPTVELFKEVSLARNEFSLKMMYGITSRWTFYAEPFASNHHDTILPKDLITHTHIGNGTQFFTNQIKYGKVYPYLFDGFYFYSKYRIISDDGEDSHFRVALYGEYSTAKVAHDEAEPELEGDNGGYGYGFIMTRLKNRFAVTLSSGIIIPNDYHEKRADEYVPSFIYETYLKYGRAVKYSLSFGYLLYPKEYKNYEEINWNVYMELMGKSYGAAEVIQNNENIAVKASPLKAGYYLEMYPGIQKIYNSNSRLDFSVGFNVLNRSWIHFYPLYRIGWVHYFY